MKFGNARLYRRDVSILHKIQFILFGLADPSHYLRSCYFKKFTNQLAPSKVLDAGCGRGDYSFYMAELWPKAIIESVDLNEEDLERNKSANEKLGLNNIFFYRKNLSEINETNKYDLIICIDVIEHVVDQEQVLKNFYNALNKGGYLYLHVPLKRIKSVPLNKYLLKFHEWADHEHIGDEKTKEEMLELIKNSGFNILKNQSTFYYYYGELACSLFSLFFQETRLNRLLQGLVSPICRLLCYGELLKERNEGFALAVLAQKK